MRFMMPNIIFDDQYKIIMVERTRGKATTFQFNNNFNLEHKLVNMKNAFYTVPTIIAIFMSVIYIGVLVLCTLFFKDKQITSEIVKYVIIVINLILLLFLIIKLYHSRMKREGVLFENTDYDSKVELSIESFMSQYYPNLTLQKLNVYLLITCFLLLTIPLFIISIHMVLNSMIIAQISAGLAIFNILATLFIIVLLILKYQQKLYRLPKK